MNEHILGANYRVKYKSEQQQKQPLGDNTSTQSTQIQHLKFCFLHPTPYLHLHGNRNCILFLQLIDSQKVTAPIYQVLIPLIIAVISALDVRENPADQPLHTTADSFLVSPSLQVK